MTNCSASFSTPDECNNALAELKHVMKISHIRTGGFYVNSDHDLPVNYPYTPLALMSDVNDTAQAKLSFICADKNRNRAHSVLLKYRAYDIIMR